MRNASGLPFSFAAANAKLGAGIDPAKRKDAIEKVGSFAMCAGEEDKVRALDRTLKAMIRPFDTKVYAMRYAPKGVYGLGGWAAAAADAKPDFISWHSYSQQPAHVLDQPALMRKVCAEEGFGDCELVMNEWHFLPNGKWKGIQGGTYQEKLAQRTGPRGISSVMSAAFTVQVETGFHDTPLSQSYFYGSGYNGMWGYADGYGRFNKVYYAMKLLGEMMADCEDRSANAPRLDRPLVRRVDEGPHGRAARRERLRRQARQGREDAQGRREGA